MKKIILALRSTGALATQLLKDASCDLAQKFSKGSPRLPLKYPPVVPDAQTFRSVVASGGGRMNKRNDF